MLAVICRVGRDMDANHLQIDKECIMMTTRAIFLAGAALTLASGMGVHGAEVSMKSAPGDGTSITLTFPEQGK